MKEALEIALDEFLKKAQQDKKDFSGIKGNSKHFIVYGLYDDLIVIQYDSYPKHYVLEKHVLLDGIDKVLNYGLNIRLTSDYASKIELSTIQRAGTDNKTSILTKFYYSLHRAFLMQQKTYK